MRIERIGETLFGGVLEFGLAKGLGILNDRVNQSDAALDQLLLQRIEPELDLQLVRCMPAGQMKPLRLPIRRDDHPNRNPVVLPLPNFAHIDRNKLLPRGDGAFDHVPLLDHFDLERLRIANGIHVEDFDPWLSALIQTGQNQGQ